MGINDSIYFKYKFKIEFEMFKTLSTDIHFFLSLSKLLTNYFIDSFFKFSIKISGSSQDDMNTGVSVYKITHLSDLECVGCIFECLLHLSRPKKSEVTTFLTRSTLTILLG